MSDRVYQGYQNVSTGYGEYDEWRESKKDRRIRELTKQVEALSSEIKTLRETLAQMYAKVMAA
jgi:predicted RNase H-like nuclease (RuvC/YqgF family)